MKKSVFHLTGLAVVILLFIVFAFSTKALSSSLTFTESGGTQDAGVVTYSQAPHTWTVTLPSNFTKVETIQYDAKTPTTMKKYMGWNGYLKVNGTKVWEFKSFSSETGGVIYDATLGKEVSESSGSGLWIDATSYFKAGSNTVVFYHYTSGDGIGLKIKVTTSGATTPTLKKDGESCTKDSECSGEYCVHNICRGFPFYWGDGYCDSSQGETCLDPSDPDFCSPDCKSASQKDNGGSCTSSAECKSGNCGNKICCAAGKICCSADSHCSSSQYCDTSNHYCQAKSSDGSTCTNSKTCTGGYCVHGKCRSNATYCGDKSCDSPTETCTNCAGDCGECKKKDGESCTAAAQCESGNCVQSTCRPKGYTWCGDKTCQESEGCDCQDCQSESRCQKTTAEISAEFKQALTEYHNIFNYLEKKIDVPELKKMSVSPKDMHDAIESLAEQYQGTNNEIKGLALLKNAIAAEELGLAVYEAEEEMAGMLAETSWQSLEAYLFYKIKAIISSRLEVLAENDELKEMADDFSETATIIAGGVNDNSLADVLTELGITDKSQVDELVKTVKNAYSDAKGSTQRYIDNLENKVKSKYIEIYKKMFLTNFEEAISNQIVYFLVGLWHQSEIKGSFPNTSNTPYQQYKSKIEEMKKQLALQKDFVEGGDNVFDKITKMNTELIETTNDLGELLDQAATLAKAADKGAELANKKTQFEEVINQAKEYNSLLNSALESAADVLDVAGQFAKSLFGTYQEAKIYTIFFNAYSDWCGQAMTECSAVLRVPGTDIKINIESIYQLGRTAGGTVDSVATKAGDLAYTLAAKAEALMKSAREAFVAVATKAKTTIKQAEKITKEFVYSAKQATTNQLVAWCNWGIGLISYKPAGIPIISLASADEKTVIEFALISPSGVRYAGTASPDGQGAYVVIDNPEDGEWKTEMIGKEVKGEQEVQIALNVDEIKPGEIKQTLPELAGKETTKKTSYTWIIIVAVAVIVVIIAVLFGLKKFKVKK